MLRDLKVKDQLNAMNITLTGFTVRTPLHERKNTGSN
jgi:hypothetical protein